MRKNRVSIFSDFVEYNANSRNKNAEDCVKRAICFALGIDYDEVSKGLNEVRKKLHADAYNQDVVWTTYLHNKGYSVIRYPDKDTTVEEFCQDYPEGTYILEVGKEKLVSKGYGDHLCCVLDGDVYDSWDSRNRVINKWCVVSTTTSGLNELDEQEIKDQILEFVREYVQKLSKKSKLEGLQFVYIDSRKEPYTLQFQIFGVVPKNVPTSSLSYRPGISYGHNIYAKMNPRLSQEENIDNLKKKVKQKVYDWWYNINKEVSDAYTADSIEVNENYRGSRSDLMKVPEWARPLMLNIYVNPTSTWGGGYKYEAYMEALPDDPRINDPGGNEVAFYADTLTEFKQEFEYYKKDYARYGYEY